MGNITWQALREKEVLCISDGRRMGQPCDLEIDLTTGQICALLLPGDESLFSLKRRSVYRVAFCDIIRVGVDLILVKCCQRVEHCDHGKNRSKK